MTENNAAQPGLTTEQILSLERRGNMTDDEALRFGRAIESALLSKLRAEGVQAGDERAAFEVWARKRPPYIVKDLGRDARDKENYGHATSQTAWIVWQARAALASAPVACNCPGGNKPADLHAPNCPVRQSKAKLLDPYDGGTWVASAPVSDERECGNADCGWRGTTERMCGSVGPLCPECGEITEAIAPVAGEARTEGGDPASPRDDSDRTYDRPIGYLPAYELGRLHSGHDASLRSAKFGPSALDGDVPVYLEPPKADAAPQASEAVRNAGIELAAAWVDKRRHDFDHAHGYMESDTGAWSFGRGDGATAKEEYSAELAEIAEGLRALKTQADKDGGDWKPQTSQQIAADMRNFARADGFDWPDPDCAKGAGEEDERLAFEAWAATEVPAHKLGRAPWPYEDQYNWVSMDYAWSMWRKIRAALAAQPSGNSGELAAQKHARTDGGGRE